MICDIHKVEKNGQFLHCIICGHDWENKLFKTSTIHTKEKRKFFKSKQEMIESFLVYGFLLGVLFPIRILFVNLVGDSWIGSLGVMTLVYVIIIILIKKKEERRVG